MTAQPVVRVDVGDGIATLTLDDPSRRNAISLAMIAELATALDSLEADATVAAIVLTGAGPAFCAGADLGDLEAAATGSGGGPRAIYEGFLRVQRCGLPTIAAVNGAALGAGLNLALCCDVRLAGRSARFESRFAQLGLHPGGGHAWMLHRLGGPQLASAMTVFGDVLGGDDAARAGLVYECVDDGELLTRARAMAVRAAAVPRDLLMRVKQTAGAVGGVAGYDEAVELELAPQLWSIEQGWFRERLMRPRQRAATAKGGQE